MQLKNLLINFFSSKIGALLLIIAGAIFLLKDIFFIDGQLMAGDWSLPITSTQMATAAENFSSAWTTMGNLFGTKQVSMTLAPLYSILDLFSSWGMVVSARFILVFLFALAGFSMYLLLRFLKLTPLASLLGGFFYMVTPIFFNYTIMGWIFALFFLGLLPLGTMFFIRAHQERRLSLALIVGILYAISMLQAQAIFWFMILFVILGFYLINSRDDFIFYLKQLGLVIAIFLLLSSYWLLDVLLVSNSGVSGSDIVNSEVSLGILGHFLPLNIIRLFGSLYNFQYETVLKNFSLISFSFALPLLIIGSFFIKKRKKLVLVFWLIALIPFGMYILNFRRDLLAHIPFSNVIRDFARFTVFSSFAYAALAGLIIDNLVGKRGVGKKIALSFVIALLILMVFPWWKGELTDWPSSLGSDMRLRGKIYPESYYHLENELAKKKIDQKVLFFPIGGILDFQDDPKNHGLFNETQDIFAGFSPVPGVLTVSDRSHGYLADYIKVMRENSKDTIVDLLRLSNIGYFVIRKNIVFDGKETLIELLNKEERVEKEFEDDKLVVFKRKETQPRLYVSRNNIFSRRSLDKLLRVISDERYPASTAIFFESQNEGESLGSRKELLLRGEKKSNEIVDSFPVLETKKVNLTKYRIRVHGAREIFSFVFSESFHEGWKSYLVKPNNFQVSNSKLQALNKFKNQDSKVLNEYKILGGNEKDQATRQELEELIRNGWATNLGNFKERKIKHLKWNAEKQREELDYIEKYRIDFVSENFQGTIQNNNLPNGQIFETWFKKPIDERRHLMVNGYANGWIIDPEEICEKKNYGSQDEKGSGGPCVRNSDGSYDLELVIEFWPQRLFHLGALISLATLFGCIGYLIYDWKKNKSIFRKNEKK